MSRPRHPLVVTAAAVVAAALLALTGCTSAPAQSAPDGPRLVTDEESQTLALIRFNNFDAGARSISATLDDRGHELVLDGRVDYTTHTGLALLTVDGVADRELIWDGALLAARPATGSGVPEVPTELDDWPATNLEAAAAPLQALLIVLATFGADRPENPLLLRQGGALWLRSDSIGDEPVTVFAGPSDGAVIDDEVDPDAASVRYWIDDEGVLLRAEVRLGDSWATVDFGDAEGATVPALLDDVAASP